MRTSLMSIEQAIRAGWCLWTSDPVDQPGWSSSNPASGQCASTALVVQDLLGGDLLMADVHEADGTRQGVHYWNRLPGDVELDLTREQFRRGEVVGEPRKVERPRDVTRGRLPGHYHLLAARVARGLADAAPEPRAVTVKAVCRQPDGRVLLCRNQRDQWELPGGRPDVGELFPDGLRRALREQTGIEITVDNVAGVRALEVLPGTWIDVVAYECIPARDRLRPSAEHAAVAFLETSTLDAHELPPVHAQLIAGGASPPGPARNPWDARADAMDLKPRLVGIGA